jgi:hypothetical protein
MNVRVLIGKISVVLVLFHFTLYVHASMYGRSAVVVARIYVVIGHSYHHSHFGHA